MNGFVDIEFATLTDVGCRRSHNQDSHVAMPASDRDQWQARGHVFLVADGMGAHAVGELASKIAVDNIPHIYSKYARDGAHPALQRAFVEANQAIHTRGQQNADFRGMGTTGTALVLRPEGAWIGHVGDSRVYRVRGGLIEQLSFDHSLLWELARRQQKNPEELHGIPPNVIVRSLGPEPAVQVDVEGPYPVEPGDVYLLCSDGLSGQVSDRELGAVMSALPPAEACRFLVHLANLQGGPDNITVIIARVRGTPAPLLSPSQADVMFPTITPSFVRRLAGVVGRIAGIVPWPFLLIVFGILLGAGAIEIMAMDLPKSMAVAALVLAGVSLLSGLAALVIQNLREAREEQLLQTQTSVVHIYRQTTCAIDESLLSKLVQATDSLQAGVKDKGWQYEVESFQTHVREAKKLREDGDLGDAFAEQARALLVLMDAVHRQRGKGESFNPFWHPPEE